MIAEGRTGVMSGKGYFDWGKRSPDELFRERDRKLLAIEEGAARHRNHGGDMIKYDLAGKAAIVTGAASGIGLATATMLARNGCTVAVNFLPGDARGPEAVSNLRQEGLSAIEAPGHVGKAKEGVAMIEDTIRKLGRLDLLVNNAGTPGVTEVVPAARPRSCRRRKL